MAKDFFDALTNYDPVKEIVPLAFHKFQMDMEQSKLNMAKDQYEREKNAQVLDITRKNAFAEAVKAKGTNITPMDLLTIGAQTQAIGPSEIIKEAATISKPISIGRGGLATSGGVPIPGTIPQTADKPLSDIGKLQFDKDRLLKMGMSEDHPSVKAINDEIKKKSESKEKETNFQEKGVTEKGGLTVSYDPKKAKTFITKTDGSMEDYDPKKHGKILSTTLAQTTIYNQSQANLSEDAVRIEGAKYATTGVMPPLGMNNPILRAKIVNSGAEYVKNMGVNPSEVPAFQAGFKGAKDSYVSLKKATENISAFENAMLKNMDYAGSLSDKYYRTSMPPVNTVLNAIRKGSGDPKVVEFGNAVYSAALEFEKIRTAGSNITSAELSVGAQEKAEDILNKSMNHDQFLAAMKAMKTDARNVMGSKRDTLKRLDDEMRKMPGFDASNVPIVEPNKHEESNGTWEELKKKKGW